MILNSKKIFYILFFGLFLFLPITTLKVQAQHNDNHGEKIDHNHQHKTLDISNNSNIPTINIEVYPDKIKGWNLEIKTTNFSFNPENINKESKANEGHAHLYVNGKKFTRIYSNWYYIPQLPKGKNEINVTLNTNLHEDLIYNGKVIKSTIIINNN